MENGGTICHHHEWWTNGYNILLIQLTLIDYSNDSQVSVYVMRLVNQCWGPSLLS